MVIYASERLLDHARDAYPPGGSIDGTPSYELFCSGPLNAATWDCEHGFAQLPEARPGIRVVRLFSKFFGPLEILARQTENGMIELLDFVPDPDYWNMVENDPEDD